MEIRNFKDINKGSLRAKFDLYLPKQKVTYRDVIYVCSDSSEFISLPSREYMDQNTGAKKYFKYIIFDKEIEQTFQDQVLALVRPMCKSVKMQGTQYIPGKDDELPF